MLDEIGGDRLVERCVRKGEVGDVRNLEREPGKERAGGVDRERLGVNANRLATERREEVRDGSCGAAEVEDAVPRPGSHELAHRREPQPCPRRLLEIRTRHRLDERAVVLARRASEGEPGQGSPSSSSGGGTL